MRDKLAQVVKIIGDDPAVDNVTGFTGGGQSGATIDTARMFIALKPQGERGDSADAVIARLRGRLASVPGAPTYLQAVQDLRVGGMASAAQYQYTLRGDDLTEVNAWGPRVAARLARLPQLVDLNSDQQDRGSQSRLVIDRATASRFGIAPQLIDDTLYDAFGQRPVSTMFTPLNQYHVVMEVAPPFWQRPDTLGLLRVRAPSGASVPLSAFARYEPSTTSLAVAHQSQFPSVALSFNPAPGVLTAFQGVEDSLAALRILEEEAHVESQAVESATRSVDLTTNQYKAGTVSYLNVITAQTIALTDQLIAVQILGRRMTAAVLLIQSLGGGWTVSELPTDKDVSAER